LKKYGRFIEEYKINALYYLAFIHKIKYETNSIFVLVALGKGGG
jgi:hypothetical protein